MKISKYLAFILACFSIQSHAVQLTVEQAINRAILAQCTPAEKNRLSNDFFGKNSFQVISAGKVDSLNTYYVVTSPRKTMIVSADNVVQPILGILDKPVDSFDDVPPALLDLLDQHSTKIAQLVSSASNMTGNSHLNKSMSRSRINMPTIHPLIPTEWGQYAPFNDYAPCYKDDSSSDMTHCPAGCGPVALAQLLYYYQAPKHPIGTGGPIYLDSIKIANTDGIQLDVPENNIHWENIRPLYEPDSYSSDEGTAVAQLIKICGLALKTNYSKSVSVVSSQNIMDAFDNNFELWNDDSEVMEQNGTLSSADEWNKEVYRSLGRHHPVYYSGNSKNDGDGHAFLVDGYVSQNNQDLFHCNFGWAGKCDGDYSLQLFDPANPAIGFIYRQKAFLDFYPKQRSIFQSSQVNSEDGSNIPTQLLRGNFSKPITLDTYINISEKGKTITHLK